MEGASSAASKVGGQSDQLLQGRRVSHVFCGLPDPPVLDCVEWDRLVWGGSSHQFLFCPWGPSVFKAGGPGVSPPTPQITVHPVSPAAIRVKKMHYLQNRGPRPCEERHALGILVAGRGIRGGHVAGFP